MRGMKLGQSLVRGTVFIGALLGLSSAAFAQKDPQTLVFLDNVTACPDGYRFDAFSAEPDKKCVKVDQSIAGDALVAGRQLTSVTLSRDNPKLETKAAYDLVIRNNTTNALNRLYFVLTFTDNNGDPADNVTFNTVLGGNFSCTLTPLEQGQQASCTSLISLAAGSAQAFVVVLNAPKSGSQLNVTGSAGGYEGNSLTGQGCCASPLGTVATLLIDSVNDTTYSYTVNAITFVDGTLTSTFFTGNRRPSRSDPFTTEVTVSPFAKKYDVGSIFETTLPADPGTNCKNGNRFKSCGAIQISLPQVSYVLSDADKENVCAAPVLGVTVRIDPSLIKGSMNNFDPTQVKLLYTDDKTLATTLLSQCALGAASLTLPCTCGTPTGLEYKVINDKNGRLEFF